MSMRSHNCGQVTDALIGQEVTLSGWVNRRRDHGGVIFIDLRDREGFVQVVCDPDRPEMFALAEDRKSTRLNSSHSQQSRMPSSA